MNDHSPKIITQERCCSVSKCECGVYHLNYQWATIHLNLETLIKTMEIAYNYNVRGDWYKSDEPLRIEFGPAMLLVEHEDFNDFYKALEDATTIEMNIDKLISDNTK